MGGGADPEGPGGYQEETAIGGDTTLITLIMSKYIHYVLCFTNYF